MTFKTYSPNQSSLLPPSLEDFLGESHRAVILNEFIDELDTSQLVQSYHNQNGGSSAYHPVMLLKILIYGYSNATFSSRKIATKLREDIAFMFLAGNNQPDFRTIARFRQEKGDLIENIFSKVVKKAKEMGYIDFGTCSIDGTKIYADASVDKNFDEQQLKDKIHDLIEEADNIDAIEDKLYGDNEDDIDPGLKTKAGREKKKQQLKQKENKARTALSQMPKSNKSRSKPKLNTTDPDSRLIKMKKNDFANGYNVQNMTDNGFIVANYINNLSADQSALVPTLKKLKSTLNTSPKRLLADKGYSTTRNYSFCEKHNIDAYIPIHHENIDMTKYIYNRKDDTYTDKKGKIFHFKQHMKLKSKTAKPKKTLSLKEKRNLYKFVIYENVDNITGDRKYLTISKEWINHCKRQKKKLSTYRGKELYKKRNHDVEGVFGNIKKNLKFTHFNLRGFNGVKTEWNLISIAHNIQKLATA